MADAIAQSLDELECAAEALRRYEQGGKRLNAWSDLPRSTQKKWIDRASIVLAAIQTERERANRVREAAAFANGESHDKA